MTERVRSWWGWGFEDAACSEGEVSGLGFAFGARFGVALSARAPRALESIALPAPRFTVPAALAHLCTHDPRARASHTYGKSYRDVVRGFHGELASPPDVVASPRTEADLVALLDFCAGARVAAVPYGAGSSVVGGVECAVGGSFTGALSIDLQAMDRVLEVDPVSRAARIQAGARGPVLEEQLKPHGYTLRHFPQSFEFSTLGGWLATRAGGHYATVYTHIDDLVESMRVVTPAGTSESRRLPGSGAGPSPDRMFLGSEGTLGVITEAWLRVQAPPRWRGSAGVRFARYEDGVTATRLVAQSGLFPTNCRLLDGGEAALAAGAGVVGALLVLGFESADHPVGPWIERAVELCRGCGGEVPGGIKLSDAQAGERGRGGEVEAWRTTFLRAPYLRDALVRLGIIAETFETACTWRDFPGLHAGVVGAVTDALMRICGGGAITCRFTHVYPDGPAPYFTVYAPTRFGSELSMWGEVKAAASEAILAAGGTITHHHAVGRDHRPYYERQRPAPFALALAAAKRALDPAGICNPGVLLPAP